MMDPLIKVLVFLALLVVFFPQLARLVRTLMGGGKNAGSSHSEPPPSAKKIAARCYKCGTPLPTDARFCPKCGRTQDVIDV